MGLIELEINHYILVSYIFIILLIISNYLLVKRIIDISKRIIRISETSTYNSMILDSVVTTLKELSQFLTLLGVSLTDRKVSKEELRQKFSECQDVLDIWKETPEKFKVKKK